MDCREDNCKDFLSVASTRVSVAGISQTCPLRPQYICVPGEALSSCGMIRYGSQTATEGSICHQGAIMLFQPEVGQANRLLLPLPGEMIPLPPVTCFSCWGLNCNVSMVDVESP